MGKRLSYDFVKEQFENEGYELLSKEYNGAHAKLNYICPKGHCSSIRWNCWRSGHRCGVCGIELRSFKQRFSYDFVKKSFEDEGYIFLTKIYKNTSQKLYYVCPVGHRGSVIYNNWRTGTRCSVCGGSSRTTYSRIKSSLLLEGYKLIFTNYKNNKQLLECVCSNGHKWFFKWNSWQLGHRCPICANISISGSGHPNWKGGISCEPYCDAWKDKEYKNSIKERDNYKCQNPDCWGTSNRLAIHHIDYNKKNCGPDNLITVCISCNARANHNREWHTEWYKIIMGKRYGHKY